jgi:hypothetical protein
VDQTFFLLLAPNENIFIYGVNHLTTTRYDITENHFETFSYLPSHVSIHWRTRSSQRKITKSTNCTFLWISASIHYSTRILQRKSPRCLELRIVPSPLKSGPSVSQPSISAMILSIRFSMNLNCSFPLYPTSAQIYTIEFWTVHSPGSSHRSHSVPNRGFNSTQP